MSNEYLIPANVIDITEKLQSSTNVNEKENYIFRLEVIRDYCNSIIVKSRDKPFFYKPKKK